jgi:hypothetical protein
MHRNEFFWGGALIAVGVLLLLGIVFKISVWALIGPLFLIALGAWIIWGIYGRPAAAPAEPAAVPLEGASRARITVHHGAGRLTIGGGAEAGNLLDGTFTGGVQCHTRREGDRMEVDLQVARSSWPWVWGTPGLAWNLRLNPDVPLSLKLETGGNEALLDLTELRVEELRLSTGASATEVLLPARAGFTKVKVGAGVATVRLRVPEGVAAKFEFEGGLATANVDTSRFPRAGGEYCSPDYAAAANKVDIEVEAGVGSVDLR